MGVVEAVDVVVERGGGGGKWMWTRWLKVEVAEVVVEAVETEEVAAVGEGGWVLAAVAQGGSGGQSPVAAAVG